MVAGSARDDTTIKHDKMRDERGRNVNTRCPMRQFIVEDDDDDDKARDERDQLWMKLFIYKNNKWNLWRDQSEQVIQRNTQVK